MAPLILVNLCMTLFLLYGAVVGFTKRMLLILLQWNFASNLGLFLVNTTGSFFMIQPSPWDKSNYSAKEYFFELLQFVLQLPIFMSTFLILHYFIKVLDNYDY